MESKFHKAVFELVNDALLACPLPPGGKPGKFTALNQRAEALLGFNRKQLLGMSPSDILEPGDEAAFSGDGLPRQVRLLRQDGRRVTAELHSHLLDHGGVPCVLGVLRNMSSVESLRLELERVRETGEAQAGFIKEISVEMKKPASAIKQLSDYAGGAAQADEQEKQLESLKHHSEDLLSQVNDLLEFYELEGDKPVLKLDKTTPASSSNALRRSFLKRGLRLEVELGDGLPPAVTARPGQAPPGARVAAGESHGQATLRETADGALRRRGAPGRRDGAAPLHLFRAGGTRRRGLRGAHFRAGGGTAGTGRRPGGRRPGLVQEVRGRHGKRKSGASRTGRKATSSTSCRPPSRPGRGSSPPPASPWNQAPRPPKTASSSSVRCGYWWSTTCPTTGCWRRNCSSLPATS